MQMKNLATVTALFASLVLFAACGAKPETAPEPPPQQQTTADTSGVDDANAGVTDAAGPSGELLSKRIVYFDFDRADIRADSQTVVAAHARYLAANPTQKVRLEGHADERGSREYNIGLGERRGQAVRRALLLQGVSEVQLSTVSYGEERPAAAGSDEQTYALNRRVEIIYVR
jgi:peptidoglycan-associated lipoprotein